jgi:hypothetical protein
MGPSFVDGSIHYRGTANKFIVHLIINIFIYGDIFIQQ